jgi:hypothetical protein
MVPPQSDPSHLSDVSSDRFIIGAVSFVPWGSRAMFADTISDRFISNYHQAEGGLEYTTFSGWSPEGTPSNREKIRI